MASKIICINVGGIKEILNNKNGYIIPPKNIKKISEAIDKALLSKETIKKRKAYYEVKNNFRDDEMFSGYDKIYKKILNYK
jgi:glycosyltransferase involved in cell wall biosynthesis